MAQTSPAEMSPRDEPVQDRAAPKGDTPVSPPPFQPLSHFISLLASSVTSLTNECLG